MTANTVQATGISGIADVPWGAHLCVFYRSASELSSLASSFLAAGLKQGQYCLWITAAPVHREDAITALRLAIAAADKYIDRGQIEIIPYTDWYIQDGQFQRDAVIRAWQEKAALAARSGFEGIRITGNPAWLHTAAQWTEFGAYEREVHEAIRHQRILALCTYPLHHCDPERMQQVMLQHSHAIYPNPRQGEKWSSMRVEELSYLP
jgi:hypothetical protein